MIRTCSILALGCLSACSGAGLSGEGEEPQEERKARTDLEPADPVGLNAPSHLWNFNYFDHASNFHNLFLMKNGRGLAVLVQAKPTPLNTYGGDEFFVWDVTDKDHCKGLPVSWDSEPTSLHMKDVSGKRYEYDVRLENREQDRVLRVEGGGSWFEVSVRGLLLGRTREARELGEGDLPGFRRLQGPRTFEYFDDAQLKGAGEEQPVLPRYVIDPYDKHGYLVERDHPVGDTGYVLKRFSAYGEIAYIEEKAQEGEAGRERTPEQLFEELKAASVVIRSEKGQGSGSFVSSEGLVITNAHVVEGVDEVAVTCVDGRELRGKVVARSETADLALVRVPGRSGDFKRVEMEPNLPKVGTSIVYIAAPKGFSWTFGKGHVAAIRRVAPKKYPEQDYLQLQLQAGGGSSGGPILNMQGRQAGLIVSGFDEDNITFAIPASVALKFIQEHAEK